jgi:hypothetical protein
MGEYMPTARVTNTAASREAATNGNAPTATVIEPRVEGTFSPCTMTAELLTFDVQGRRHALLGETGLSTLSPTLSTA